MNQLSQQKSHKSHSNLDDLRRGLKTNLQANKNEISRSYEDISCVNSDDEKESDAEFDAEEETPDLNNKEIINL